MNEKQTKMYNALTNLGTTEAVDIILSYHGLQLLDDEFYEYLQEEGILDEDEEEKEIFECPNCGLEYDSKEEAIECCEDECFEDEEDEDEENE